MATTSAASSPRRNRCACSDWTRFAGCSNAVIAAGGGGIPVVRGTDGHTLHGVEAVIDKDLCSGVLAHALQADCLVIATDVAAVYLNWGTPQQRALGQVSPKTLAGMHFPAGSMGPKIDAACRFVRASGQRAAIGSLDQIEAMLAGEAGTQITMNGGDAP
jgi:carbamate kinase